MFSAVTRSAALFVRIDVTPLERTPLSDNALLLSNARLPAGRARPVPATPGRNANLTEDEMALHGQALPSRRQFVPSPGESISRMSSARRAFRGNRAMVRDLLRLR